MIKIIKDTFAPSRGLLSYVPDSIRVRCGYRDVESTIRIVRLEESAYYNRIDDYDMARMLETDETGTCVINAPNIFTDDARRERKGASNAFFPAGSVIVAINVLHKDIGGVSPADLLRFSQDGVFGIVKSYVGIPRVMREGNDILLDGRKFYGEERGQYEDAYSITGVCTCTFAPFRDQFDGLRNHGVREITGVCDRIPELTQDKVMDALYQRGVRMVYGRKEWEKPAGYQTAYMTGERVIHAGKVWRSTVDLNTWEPGVYGWAEVEVNERC